MRTVAHRVLVALVAAFVVAASCNRAATPPAEAPAPSGPPTVFRGVVMDYLSSQRLANTGIELALVGQASKPFAGTVSDEKGEFAFAGISAGEYMIRVAHPGYQEVRMRVEAKSSEQKPLDVRLRTIAAAQRCLPSRYHTLECP